MIYPTRYPKCPVKNDSTQPDHIADISKKVDLIDKQAAIDDLRDKDPSQIWDTADVEVWVNSLPSAQPELIEKTAYIRGFEQGRTQGIIDTKAEEVAQPNLQPICNQLATDTISRQAAIRWVKTECNPYGKPTLDYDSGKKVIEHLEAMPSVQPELSEWAQKVEEYRQSAPEYIHNPLAWALYQTWKEYDG